MLKASKIGQFKSGNENEEVPSDGLFPDLRIEEKKYTLFKLNKKEKQNAIKIC